MKGVSEILVNVKVYYFSVFGKGAFTLGLDPDATVLDALNILIGKFGDDFEKETGRNLMEALQSYFNVFLNGKHLDLPSELMHGLEDGDQLIILRPVGGG
ncbi:MAG: MoaD/ThiS family protein [Candidatus Bathyarchaeota archaeon]|nr:MoaD/ThiS family protein [Candidatus Bathyarchaeota archaeon]